MKEWLASLSVTSLILIFLAVILVLILLAFLLFLARRSWNRLNELKPKDRFAARTEFIKTTAQILGGIFFIITIIITYWNFKVAENNFTETQNKNREDLSIARDKQTTELYVKAIEQLGSDKLEVRLGAIYALERIARQSPKYHWPIMEVFTAYLRENSPWPPEKYSYATKKRPWARPRDVNISQQKKIKTEDEIEIMFRPDPDIQAILTVIGRRARTYNRGEDDGLDLSRTDLRWTDLIKAHLEGAILDNANLEEAELFNAFLEEATFYRTNLNGTDLQDADLQGAEDITAEQLCQSCNWILCKNLPDDILKELQAKHVLPQNYINDFHNRDFSSYNLSGMDLRNVTLRKFNLQKAIFKRAKLKDATFVDCDLEGADLRSADLRGADLTDTKGLTYKQVAGAFWDETTKWPEGFTPPAPRRDPPQARKEKKKEEK